MRLFDQKVRKSNELIRAEECALAPEEPEPEAAQHKLVGDVLKPRLIVPAKRILSKLVSELNRTKSRDVEINLNEIEKATGSELKTKDYKACALTLVRVAYSFSTPDDYTVVPLFNRVSYKIGTRKIRAIFSDEAAKFINEVLPFTQYDLSDYLALSSVYAQNLFEFLKSWERQKKITISIAELQKLLHFPDGYRKQRANLKKYVLEIARKEMKNKISFIFSYKFNAAYRASKITFTIGNAEKEPKELKPKQAAYLCALHLVNKNLSCEIYANAKYEFQNYQEEQKCTQCRICKYMETLRQKKLAKQAEQIQKDGLFE